MLPNMITTKFIISTLFNNHMSIKKTLSYCKLLIYGKSIEDEKHLCMMVKYIVDDYDQRDGFIFNRWLSDMDTNGEEIDFEKLI